MSLFEKAAPRPGGFREVSVHEVAAGVRGARFVDVREVEEYRGELVPLGAVPVHASQWPRDEAVVLICRSGRRSEQAALKLREMGFERVINVVGGMLAWQAHGLPVER